MRADNGLGKMHNVAQPILSVAQFDLIAQVSPVQIRVFTHHPRQGLHKAGVQISLHYGVKNDASRVLGLTRRYMCKSWITEPRKLSLQIVRSNFLKSRQ